MPAASPRPPSPSPPHYGADSSSSAQPFDGVDSGPSLNSPYFSSRQYHAPEDDSSQVRDPGYGARSGGW